MLLAMKKITLKKCRQRKGLTQAEAANELKITSSYFSEIERGVSQPSPKLLFKIDEWAEHSVDLGTLRSDIWED
jgi:transcriptional regulator with XRE-family HTH domain